MTGKFSNTSGEKVSIAIYDNQGELVRIEQVKTSTGGTFNYSTPAAGLDVQNEAYQCIISASTQKHPVWVKFGTGYIYTVIDSYMDKGSSAGATVTTTFDNTRLYANRNMTAELRIKNKDTVNNQPILAFWVLTDTNDNIIRACGNGSVYLPGETKNITLELQLPSSVTGHKLKMFIWQGENIDSGSLCALADVKTITTSGTSTQSMDEGLMENVLSEADDTQEPAEELEVNGQNPIHVENADDIVQFSDLDVAAVKQTAPVIQNQQARALNEHDYIEMNYQVRSQGQNTGGILNVGKNIVTIYFKNKTNQTQEFDPLVLWGYYDDNGELQQTYFSWNKSVSLAPKGNSDGKDVLAIDYEVEVPEGLDFAAGYWAINGDMDYVCLNPTALRYDAQYKEMATPLVFEEQGGGTFIYCNNHEGIRQQDLSTRAEYNDGYTPTLIMNNPNLGVGNYTMFIYHSNHTGFNIELDAQFFSNNAEVTIKSIGFETPNAGESWACLQSWADYKNMEIRPLLGGASYEPTSFTERDMVLNTNQSVDWLSNYISDYSAIADGNVVNIVVDFEVTSGSVDVNIAALKSTGILRDRSQHDSNALPGEYFRDYQYKGIADTLPIKNARLYFSFDGDNVNEDLPVTVFNQYHKGGSTVTKWITNLNPHDTSSTNMVAESDMLSFDYYDGKKLQYYGENVPDAQKDPVWHFDVSHSDTKAYVDGVPYTPGDYIPNYPLSVNIDNSQTKCNLGNWAVSEQYVLSVRNFDSAPRTFTYKLSSSGNNIVAIRNHAGMLLNPVNLMGVLNGESNVYAVSKGEQSSFVEDDLFTTTIPSMTEVNIIIEQLLPGASAGMQNRFHVN